MAAAIAADPTSGTHLSTVFNANVTGAPANTATGYDTAKYPTEPAVVYYATFTASGEDTLTSPLFSTNAGGSAAWLGVIIPSAGTWTLTLLDSADDSTVDTATVVVS